MNFDEQPDDSQHGECAVEIARLERHAQALYESLLDFVRSENTSVTRELMTPRHQARLRHATAVLANYEMERSTITKVTQS